MRDSVPKVMLAAIALALLQLGLCAVRPAAAAETPVSTVLPGNRRAILVPTPKGLGALTLSMLDGSRTGGYWDLGERAGALRPKAKRVVLLGLGGGEMLRAARRSLPATDLLGVDNDPRMLRAAREEFKIGAFGARGELADAFAYVKTLRGADVLMVDLFVGDTMPAATLQASFWKECRAAVTPGGLVMVNVYPAELVNEVSTLMLSAGLLELERHKPEGTGAFLIATRR